MMVEFKAFIGTEFISKYEKNINENFNVILKHLTDDFYEMTNEYQREEKMINIKRRCIDTRKRWIKSLDGADGEAVEDSIALWKENQSALLTDFPYLQVIPKRSLKAAYKNDIFIMFYRYICSYEEKNDLTKVPTIFSNILVDTTNRATIYSKGDIKTLEKYTDIS